jgi:hypothetical protein
MQDPDGLLDWVGARPEYASLLEGSSSDFTR